MTKRAAPRRLGKHRLDRLVEEAIIDAYGESEQRVGLLSMLGTRRPLIATLTQHRNQNSRVDSVGGCSERVRTEARARNIDRASRTTRRWIGRHNSSTL
jgi:hypothetical protein